MCTWRQCNCSRTGLQEARALLRSSPYLENSGAKQPGWIINHWSRFLIISLYRLHLWMSVSEWLSWNSIICPSFWDNVLHYFFLLKLPHSTLVPTYLHHKVSWECWAIGHLTSSDVLAEVCLYRWLFMLCGSCLIWPGRGGIRRRAACSAETCSNLLWWTPRSIIRANTAVDNLSCRCGVDQESFSFGRRISHCSRGFHVSS